MRPETRGCNRRERLGVLLGAGHRRRDTAAEDRAHTELKMLLEKNIIVALADASENWTAPNPPTGPDAVFADDGGLEWLRATYAQAAAGNPQRLVDRCRANGPG